MSGRSTRHGCALRIAWRILLPALLLSPSVTLAGEIDTLVRLSHQRRDEPGLALDENAATLNVNWTRPISRTLSSRLSFRYVTSSQEALFGMQPLAIDTENLVEPRYEFRWLAENYEFSLGARYVSRRSNPDAAVAVEQRETDLFARFNVAFENRPQLLLEWDRRKRKAIGGVEDTSSRLLGTLSYQGNGWRASGGARNTVQDTVGVLRREGDELLFDASLSKSLAGGRVSTFATVSLTDITAVDLLQQQSLVPIPRVVLAGLSALDPIPLDGPLNVTPALVDGNRSAATSINIGGGLAGGEVGWNVGFELALPDPVDVIDVWLADPIPIANALTYQWEVYSSDDNQTWTRLSGTALRSYDEVDGRFQLVFSPTVARFVKIVNITIDDTLPAVFISEIEIFGQELREGRSESTTRTEIASASVSWTPVERITMTVGGFHNRVEGREADRVSESRDDTATVSLGFRPLDQLLGNISYGMTRRRRTLLPTDETERTSLTLTALPVEDLEVGLVSSYRRLDREGESRPSEQLSYLFRVATLLYRDLSLSAEYGEAYEESFDAPDRLRESIRAVLDMRPRDEIQFNSAYALEFLETRAAPPANREEDIINWTNRLILRPSSVLNIITQATYFDTTLEEGWATLFQFDWLPFQGGAIQLSFDYRDDVPLGGVTRKARSASLRWNMNRKMFLDIEAGKRIREVNAFRRTQSLFSVFFQGRF